MTEDLQRRTVQRGGCRLCMAPDSECVPIFATAAADKEPLSTKIQACVNIKVHQGDRLSARVCHACISYLNSWQSFKNRCYVAQKKQRGLLEMWMAKERARQRGLLGPQQGQPPQSAMANQQQRQKQMEHQRQQLQQQRILKQALSQPSGNTSGGNLSLASLLNQSTSSSVSLSYIKQEPADDMATDVEEGDVDDVDPMQFLARENDEEASAYPEDGPSILTSLGLTHINHSTELGNNHSQPPTSAGDAEDLLFASPQQQMRRTAPIPPEFQPSCTICNMKFSNRANARRHERNIHGKITDMAGNPITSLSQLSITAPMMLNRRIRKRKSLPEPVRVFDYTKPELYRELLTDSKIYFIKRHIEFLEQYQNMRCNCCNRDYPTYKFFMAHMRKKYDTLSRNLCFKCLKQFHSKAHFIAHLKKKTCVNLYRLYLADDTVSKEPLPAISTGPRVGTKEIIANKVYGCKLCDKTFRLKTDFRVHVNELHGDEQRKDQAGSACGFCKIEYEDPVLRRRHYNNMECILFLICGTCNDQFETLAQYVEHVYGTHLQPPSSQNGNSSVLEVSSINSSGEYDPTSAEAQQRLKNPQNCKICGKLYNNYYNVLRHMESKHPNELPATYRCEPCNIGFPRQSEIREHLFYAHGIPMPKVKRELFNCRICGAVFDQKEVWIDHQATNHSKFYCNLCDMETENTEEFENHILEHANTKMFPCSICKHSFNTDRGLETHLAVMHQITKDQMPPPQESIKIKTEIDDQDEYDDEGMDEDDDGDLAGFDDTPSMDDENNMTNRDNGKAHVNGNDGNNDDTMESMAKKIKLDGVSITPIRPQQLQQQQPKKPIYPFQSQIQTCHLCQETFNGKIALANHMRTHSGARAPYGSGGSVPTSRMRCRICQKRIHTKDSYKRHMLMEHQVRDCIFIKCKLCPSEFSNEKGLRVHMFRTHSVTVEQMQQDESLRPTPQKESTSSSSVTVLPRILPKLAPKLMFECDICHTVYRNKDQLRAHKNIVHGVDSSAIDTMKTEEPLDADTSNLADLDESIEAKLPIPEAWWQCRYCDETFNASKKLTIHMNSHEEHDQTDNTCKDCGNVYSSRKSLWVHRHKKHPRLPNPSTCELCEKVFFDKTELFHHLKTHSNADVFTHLEEMHQQLAEENDNKNAQQSAGTSQTNYGANDKLSCHLCGQKFHDKRVLSKHLRLHEANELEDQEGAEFATSTPLFSMLADQDASMEGNEAGGEYNYPSYQGQMVDGAYACDMCPKTFLQINALKVHRGWHFRSPNGRQVTDTENMWQPDRMSQSKIRRRSRASKPPVCPYCNSTFASGNNLRRHIVEVHKRNEAKMMRENGTVSDSVYVEKELECHACGITFNSHPEWVDHKISHARTMKPSTTFEWGCEICGKVFTRKERLLAHMVSHLSGKEEGGTSVGERSGNGGSIHSGEQNSEMGGDSQSSISSQSQSQPSREGGSPSVKQFLERQINKMQQQTPQQQLQIKEELIYNDDDDDQEDEDGENQEDDEDDEENQNIEEDGEGGAIEEDEEEEDVEDEDEDDEDINEEEEENVVETKQATLSRDAAYSCDLCQVFFRTAKELRRHVTSHIINESTELVTGDSAVHAEQLQREKQNDTLGHDGLY